VAALRDADELDPGEWKLTLTVELLAACTMRPLGALGVHSSGPHGEEVMAEASTDAASVAAGTRARAGEAAAGAAAGVGGGAGS